MMKNLMFPWKSIWAFYFIVLSGTAFSQLSGSKLLDWEGDIASRLIDSCDAFLLKEIQKSITNRSKFWHRDMRSRETYDRSIQANREHLAQIIGIRDSRTPFDHLEKMGLVAESETYRVEAVRWPSFGQVYGEGLIVYPKQSGQIKKATIVIPDADQTPEEILGISGDLKSECQIGKLYAEDGHLVIIPILVNRAPNPMKISNREFIYRAAYELGRHIIGYEIQKILSAIDWLEKNRIEDITVSGWGEGGLLALYAGAIDTRIDLTEVSGYFGSRQNIWLEPAYRNIYGLLEEFGDAEIATMVAPRTLIVHSDNGAPEIEIKPGENKGKPGRLIVPNEEEVAAEIDRTNEMMNEWNWQVIHEKSKKPSSEKVTIIELPNITNRQQRLLTELDRHNQWLLSESPYVRAEFMAELKFDSLEAFKNSVEPYREYFAKQVIGQFDYPLSDFNVRSRPIKLKNPKLQAFEVAIDVFPGIFAYGILILPEDLHPGEQRPVVVCQHGLEGRPQSTIGDQDFKAYKAFATRLAERGYITFAPQNIYIFEDRFRSLQFKANTIKKTLFSIMVPQHRQITNWLSTLPFVDSTRIAFYGLSYGGKSAMRIPPLVPKYCLSICSADFNEWVWKNASSRSPYSYVRTGEYEIFEWDLGSTFNYSEMATLIAPRPFMVERGHFDGVAPDEMVAYEYAKVRHLYSALLKIGDRTEIEWFDGPHTINGEGTFRFLDKHLRRLSQTDGVIEFGPKN